MSELVHLPVGETHQLWVISSDITDGNMGLRFGERDEVMANRESLYGHIALLPTKVVWMKTLGTDRMEDVDRINITKEHEEHGLPCDSVMTASVDRGLAIFPADCIPLIAYSQNRPVVSLTHGAKTTIEHDVHTRAIDRIQQVHGLETSELRVHMGPSILPASYRYIDIDSLKDNARWEGFIEQDDTDGYYHLDLVSLVIRDLMKIGITRDQITPPAVDTGADGAPYYSNCRSYLRQEREGRNGVAVILRELEVAA